MRGKRNVNTGVKKFIRQNLVLKKNSANLILQYITHIRANFAISPQYKGLITASCFYIPQDAREKSANLLLSIYTKA